jgi:hypothetical protein
MDKTLGQENRELRELVEELKTSNAHWRDVALRKESHWRNVALRKERDFTKWSGMMVSDFSRDINEVQDEVDRLSAILHSRCSHPDYEYETTHGPRKAWTSEDEPPAGEGWLRNTHYGEAAQGRFEHHEESYWMRRKSLEETAHDGR